MNTPANSKPLVAGLILVLVLVVEVVVCRWRLQLATARSGRLLRTLISSPCEIPKGLYESGNLKRKKETKIYTIVYYVVLHILIH